MERKVKVSYLTILNIFPNFTLTLLFSAGRWQTVLIDQPYRFCYHSHKGEDCIRMICTACRNHKPENKYTYAVARLVGHDPVSGQPIHELVEKDDYHVCKAAQSTKFLNKVFLNRCFRSIKENPLKSITKVYEENLESMKQDFFSQKAEDAETTKQLQMEFEQNVRSFRNMVGTLYKYRWNFLPKDPVVSNEIFK